MDVGQRLHTHTPSFPFLSPPLLSCTLGGTLNRFVQLSGWTTTRRFEDEEKVATNIFFFFFFNSLETRNFDYVHSLIRHCCFLLSLSMWYWTRRKIGGEREGGERGGRVYLRKNHGDVDLESLLLKAKRGYSILFDGTIFFFSNLKIYGTDFLFFFFLQK